MSGGTKARTDGKVAGLSDRAIPSPHPIRGGAMHLLRNQLSGQPFYSFFTRYNIQWHIIGVKMEIHKKYCRDGSPAEEIPIFIPAASS